MAGYLYFLIVHLAAFALYTGLLVADITIHKQLWSLFKTGNAVAPALFSTAVMYTRLMGVALGVALLAGILMMSQMHQVYGTQFWMRSKIVLVILILLLRVLNARSDKQLGKQLTRGAVELNVNLRNRILFLQIAQVILIAIIIVLSVKKFN